MHNDHIERHGPLIHNAIQRLFCQLRRQQMSHTHEPLPPPKGYVK